MHGQPCSSADTFHQSNSFHIVLGQGMSCRNALFPGALCSFALKVIRKTAALARVLFFRATFFKFAPLLACIMAMQVC